MSAEEIPVYSPQRITLLQDVVEITWKAKDLEEVKKKIRDYILKIFGIPEE